MNQEDFLTNLPSEITINILSRLPIKTIIFCKCVCKPLYYLLISPEFVKFHLSKPRIGAVVQLFEDKPEVIKFHRSKSRNGAAVKLNEDEHCSLFQIIEFEVSLDSYGDELQYNPITKVNLAACITSLPYPAPRIVIQGSVNGLLLFLVTHPSPCTPYICNPITGEYIELPPNREGNLNILYSNFTYGFGVSKMSNQHKVVRVFHVEIRARRISLSHFLCEVYTLGTGSWRRAIPPDSQLKYTELSIGQFLNGNLHWLAKDLNGCYWISCFDLQTELFSRFSYPLGSSFADLVVLGNCLCVCDSSSEWEIIIWVMKEYGVDNSWTKDFVIIGDFEEYDPSVIFHPLRNFRYGDIVMSSFEYCLFHYGKKTESDARVGRYFLRFFDDITVLRSPSFLSLKSFAMENVQTF